MVLKVAVYILAQPRGEPIQNQRAEYTLDTVQVISLLIKVLAVLGILCRDSGNQLNSV